jgi:hypothetical protein
VSVPEFRIVVPLEGTPTLYLLAESDEDAHALLVWLERVDLEGIAAVVVDGLDYLRRAA